MASTQRKDANSAPGLEVVTRRQQSRAEQLAQQCVRSKEVEPNVYWVVLNLPNQTSRTLYMGSSEVYAAMIEATARGAVAHTLEYALSR